jgi:peptide/nickel transport system substrate-binding protein
MKSAGLWISMLLAVGILTSGCQPQVVDREIVVTQVIERQVERTVEVIVERLVEVEVPPEPVDRRGAWLDTIIVVEEPLAEMALVRLEAGDIDIAAHQLDTATLINRLNQSDQLTGIRNIASYNELTFNVAGPEFNNGNLNPFAVPRIRAAMNWLIDRNYIVQEIMGGAGVPRWVAINSSTPDYARMLDVIKPIEHYYAYDLERARTVIGEEMRRLGAKQVNGVWHYNEAPVELFVLSRSEDMRREIGEYVTLQLEKIGFATLHESKIASEAATYWITGDPNEGLFHIYTGGWISGFIPRDQGANFALFYTPSGLAFPLWQEYTPTEELAGIAQRLDHNDFRSMEERREMFARALALAVDDSSRIWLADRITATPMRTEVEVAGDTYAGMISGLWAYTIRRADNVGGSIVLAVPSFLSQPWNPISGSSNVYDRLLRVATADLPVIAHPHTGLFLPNWLERAEVVVQEDLPVERTLNWVDLSFAEMIEVPPDAWGDWDAATQTFLTVGELHPEGQTALRKSTVYYPENLYERVRWHDGSPLSPADFVLALILRFDLAKEESVWFDESLKPEMDAFMTSFKGLRIASIHPLVIETWSDTFHLDAEMMVDDWWPDYGSGMGSWHAVTLGLLSQERGEVAFTDALATEMEVEWMSFVSGPALASLRTSLEQARTDNAIPFEATLGDYISVQEARARWENLTEWERRRGHLWIGTGPYYLERAFPVERHMILQRNLDYSEPANKWDRFTRPMLPEVELDGPAGITGGEAAIFEVFVSFEGLPYPSEETDSVAYWVFDANGGTAETGLAQRAAEGLWEVVLSPETTRRLPPGSTRLEVVVTPVQVGLPTGDQLQFVVTQE